MLQLLDTTLRDGAQCEGITFSREDKIRIVRALDEIGVQWIEAGNPGSNPKDKAFFEEIENFPALKNSGLVAFGATIRPGTNPESDEALKILSACKAQVKTVFGKSSLSQVEQVLHCTPEENLRIIFETISFLSSVKSASFL